MKLRLETFPVNISIENVPAQGKSISAERERERERETMN